VVQTRAAATVVSVYTLTSRRVCVQLEQLSFIELSPDGSLTILGTQPVDTGHYQCVAANDAGTTTDHVTLDVGCQSLLTYLVTYFSESDSIS